MDGQTQSISSQQLYQNLGTASAPILVDVRRQDAFGNDDRLIIGALRRPPEEVERWRAEFSASRPIVAYCNHGREISQGVTEALRRAGVEAVYLDGGISGWKGLQLPTRRKRDGGVCCNGVHRSGALGGEIWRGWHINGARNGKDACWNVARRRRSAVCRSRQGRRPRMLPSLDFRQQGRTESSRIVRLSSPRCIAKTESMRGAVAM